MPLRSDALFSERACFRVADAGADDVRGRVFDATNRSRHSRRFRFAFTRAGFEPYPAYGLAVKALQ
jgi:hypothetical protein